jgi:pimeloyl-ACP methyl ester carboxylesterase
VADLAEYLDLTVSRASSSRRFWRVVFICRSAAVLAHDVTAALGSAQAPTLITFGHYDMVCSTRFADPVSEGIRYSDIHVFEDWVPPIYKNVDGVSQCLLAFLVAQRSSRR